MSANRVAFLIDGFNVYHSVKQAIADGNPSSKWLDYGGLCSSYLSVFGKTAVRSQVEYFSAYATHLTAKPGVVVRHRQYVNALKGTGVEIWMSRFKWHPRWCSKCGSQRPGYEEKETDVAIAVKMLELCVTNTCDTLAIISGDTDLLPAIRTTHRLFPGVQVWVIFPYKRFNEELRQAADGVIRIKPKKYAQFQLPNPVVLPNGTLIPKPADW